MLPHQDSLICTQLKFCTVRNFWLRDNLYRDRCATAFDPIFCTMTQNWSQLTCTATAPERNKICTRTAKTRAIPSLYRENFLAKVPGHYTVLSSGNTTSPYCRAVRKNTGDRHDYQVSLILQDYHLIKRENQVCHRNKKDKCKK